jgi:hypothetical protein
LGFLETTSLSVLKLALMSALNAAALVVPVKKPALMGIVNRH